MSWWSKLFERRSWTLSELDSWADMGLGSGPTAAGVTVTPDSAMSVPAVFSCVTVLSQDVARTPIKFRRRLSDVASVDAVEHDLYEILGSLPNPEMSAFEFKAQMMRELLQHGRAYAEVVRRDGRIVSLWPLASAQMRVDRTEGRVKRWTYGSSQTTWLFDASQPPIFELTCESPILHCRETIATALALQQYCGSFFANSARPGGVLQTTTHLTKESAQRLKEFWGATYKGSSRAHQVAVLEGGLEFKPIAFANDESQLTETWGALNQMIAGAFRVPTWKIGDLTKTSYANMESGEMAYVAGSLDPFYQLWEDAIRRDLLTNRQYQTYTATFDRSALIRSDQRGQHAALAMGIQSGYYSQNDARRMLGLNPIPDGDGYRVEGAALPLGGREPTAA